jgi:mevalonate kinase
MTTNRQTAHGKIIWMGEHAVVYGHAALALPALNATVEVALTDSSQKHLDSPFYSGPIEAAPALFFPIRSLYEQLSNYFHAEPLTVTITPHLPLAAGMGSSAAIAAAMTRAFYHRYHRELEPQTLLDWIQRSETLAHGKPSGIDAAAVTQERPFRYVKGEPLAFLSICIKQTLLIVDSKISGSTREAVESIRARIGDEGVKEHIDSLGSLSNAFLMDLNQGQSMRLGNLMNEAHQHLKALHVSHPVLDQMVQIALANGASGAKMTGGGLGGCIIALVDDTTTLHQLIHVFREQGFDRHWIIDLERDYR